MHLFQIKLYRILSIACLAGYIWLYFNLSNFYSKSTSQIGVCLFKRVTSIPCPACGITRSILSILQGNLLQAFYWNPFGFLLLVILFITPIWLVIDAINKKDSLLTFYVAVEKKLQQKLVAIPAIALVLINWFWNIHKDL
jgi:hypothetical protein